MKFTTAWFNSSALNHFCGEVLNDSDTVLVSDYLSKGD